MSHEAVSESNGEKSMASQGYRRIKRKAVYEELVQNEPRLMTSVQCLLESYVRTERKIRKTDCPRTHHTMEQTCRTAFEILSRIKACRLGADDIRENLENLACLYDYLAKATPGPACNLAHRIRRLILVVELVAGKMERSYHMPETNWTAVRKHFEREAAMLENWEEKLVVPEMGMIRGDRLLGAGGFGVCYKATFANVIPCTVKYIKKEMFGQVRFACVDKVVASMTNHPLIVKYFACFAAEKGYITVMEYIRGVDLERVTKTTKGKGLPMAVLRPILAQLGIATQYLHYKGFIHRDIKPSNLLITADCQLKMIDFDTVKICIGLFPERKLRTFFRRTFIEFNDKESAGTLNYFPPEFFKMVPYGRACDWWAVGVSAYQMAFGRMPFRGSDDKKLEEKIRAVDYRFPKKKCSTEHLTEAKDLITKLLRKKSSERLCSHKYSDYLNHKIFDGLDFEKLERAEQTISYAGITDLMQKSGKSYSPKASGSLEQEKDNYIRPEKIKDVKDHCALLTFVSKQFQDIVAKTKKKQQVDLEDIRDSPEIWITRPRAEGSHSMMDNIDDDVLPNAYRFREFVRESSSGSAH